jgi:hypothetical protein
MKAEILAYLTDAIQRIESGGVSSRTGSHLAGIFGKAANGFEKEVKSYVSKLLDDCSLDYERDLRGSIKGPIFAKLTMGNLVAVIKEASCINPKCVSVLIPGKWKVSDFTHALQRINQCWVQVKHGDEIEGPHLVTQMKSILNLLQVMRSRQK